MEKNAVQLSLEYRLFIVSLSLENFLSHSLIYRDVSICHVWAQIRKLEVSINQGIINSLSTKASPTHQRSLWLSLSLHPPPLKTIAFCLKWQIFIPHATSCGGYHVFDPSVSPVFLVSATPLKPLNRISWNFVDMKDIMCRGAYPQEILIPFFFSELRRFLT